MTFAKGRRALKRAGAVLFTATYMYPAGLDKNPGQQLESKIVGN